jgi:Ca2+-dependent lipid-binding protein
LVDPYVKVEFAGKDLESSYIEGCFDPVWNELLILHGDFPSIAENLILKVYDK